MRTAWSHRDDGASWSEIAVTLGVTENTLRCWRRADNTKPMPPSMPTVESLTDRAAWVTATTYRNHQKRVRDHPGAEARCSATAGSLASRAVTTPVELGCHLGGVGPVEDGANHDGDQRLTALGDLGQQIAKVLGQQSCQAAPGRVVRMANVARSNQRPVASVNRRISAASACYARPAGCARAGRPTRAYAVATAPGSSPNITLCAYASVLAQVARTGVTSHSRSSSSRIVCAAPTPFKAAFIVVYPCLRPVSLTAPPRRDRQSGGDKQGR